MKKTWMILGVSGGLSFIMPLDKGMILLILFASTIIFWATSLLPDYQVSLIFMFSAWGLNLSSKEIVFSGFSSTAFWLVFCGMLLGVSVKKVQLLKLVQNWFMGFKQPSYLMILVSIALFALGFSFVMPSGVGRIVLCVPLVIVVAKNFGFSQKDKGYTGILLTFILGTSLPAFSILPANVPNMILSGLTHQLYDYELLYAEYLWATFLVLGLLKLCMIVGLTYFFYKDTPSYVKLEKQTIHWGADEKRVMVVVCVLLCFWMTDFVHGVSPAVIAMIGILFLAFPSVGILTAKDFNGLNVAALLFVVGLIGLSNVASNNEYIKEMLFTLMNGLPWGTQRFSNYMLLSVFLMICGVFLTQPSIPAIFTPLSQKLSDLSGFELFDIFVIEAVGFSTVLFPFQMPPLLIGLTLANIAQKKMIKILVLLCLLTVGVLFPLEFLWLTYVL